jgi:subfamily B ATP-binding cassette protein MsbA
MILFGGSVLENISYGNPKAAREQVIEAAKGANAHDFIIQLPHGYETQIGERGAQISGGQQQRISMARALLKDPKILILDEATSALDSESEALVQESLNHLMKGRTTFVIAHRLSTITHADKIVVLDKGEIVEQGIHSELIAQNSLYRKLYETQFNSI